MAAKAKKKNVVRRKNASPKKKKKSIVMIEQEATPIHDQNSSLVKPGPVVLPNELSIKDVDGLKASLRAVCDGDSPIQIDASAVESIDTAVLQLLVAFANSVRESSRTLEWLDPSSAFRELADLLGLIPVLGLGEDAGADDDDLCPVF